MKKFNLLLTGLIFCLLTGSTSAQMLLMKADLLTQNASSQPGYKDYAEITSLQFHVSSATSYLKGTGASVGAPIPDDITITKNIDASSNKLLPKIFQGQDIDLMEIVTLVPSGSGFAVAHKVELKNVFFTDISSLSVQGCTTGCPAIAESYKLVFKAIRITTYYPSGSGPVIPNVFSYNVPAKTFTF